KSPLYNDKENIVKNAQLHNEHKFSLTIRYTRGPNNCQAKSLSRKKRPRPMAGQQQKSPVRGIFYLSQLFFKEENSKIKKRGAEGASTATTINILVFSRTPTAIQDMN
ncbi:MAG: hypothetical protein KKH22_02615, partial [Proteobacteria bacterium]|nr:hypothetical protein [Pseudomonadota bacterium]